MKNKIPDELLELKNNVIKGMIDYMGVDDKGDNINVGYTKEDVDKCDVILSKYMNKVLVSEIYGDTEKIMAAVEEAVLSLNTLNESCNHCLIETDEREGICDFIIDAAAKAGLKWNKHDITVEWRDW